MAFIKSQNFMRIGQAISHQEWQTAAMILRNMRNSANQIGFEGFQRQFLGLSQAINHKNIIEAKQVLTIIANKRATLLNSENK